MLSKVAAEKGLGRDDGFRWRGKEITRIEGLSDAVFAVSVTLLIVSTEVPKTYGDLVSHLGDFLPFAACFAQLMLVWYEHYRFHRRYGLEDFPSTALTLVLLFVVLFYTYPLKFVFMAWYHTGWATGDYVVTTGVQLRGLFTIYGIGFILVFAIYFLLYLHAYRMREALGLNEREVWNTKLSMAGVAMYCFVGMISIAVAWTVPIDVAWLAGPTYSLIGPGGWILNSWAQKRKPATAQT